MFANKQQKILLLKFKKNFPRLRTTNDKLGLLIKYSKIIIPYQYQQSLEERRTKFDRWKYRKNKALGYCRVCGDKAEVRHHIIQLKNGGINSKKNIIHICKMCHAEIHPHLKAIMIKEADSLYEFARSNAYQKFNFSQ